VLPRREVRSNYGVEGVPIREQIVQRDGDVIITRNSYGALCLNSPDVLFADIDHAQPPAGCVMPAIVAAGAACRRRHRHPALALAGGPGTGRGGGAAGQRGTADAAEAAPGRCRRC
jgi:hypothetical protein